MSDDDKNNDKTSMTIRLPKELKKRIDKAAEKTGISKNSWVLVACGERLKEEGK